MLSLAQSSNVMSFVADSRFALHATHEETRNIGADNAVKLGNRHQNYMVRAGKKLVRFRKI